MLAVVGFLRLGNFIKFILFLVTVGFTAGIAVIIFASRVTELFGLTLANEPDLQTRSLTVRSSGKSHSEPQLRSITFT